MAVIIGISDKHTVMADLDDMAFKQVPYAAFKTLKTYRLGGFIVLKSSPKHYHLVFDKPIRKYEDLTRILASISIWSKDVCGGKNYHVMEWVIMQLWKKSCTLRISPKPINTHDCKPIPRIVYRYGSQNNMVKEYLAARERVLRMVKRLGINDRGCLSAKG